MPDDVKLKSILSEKESLNSIYNTSARIISKNAFGETITKSPEAIFSPTGNFNGLFVGIGFAETKDERNLNSTLSTGVFFQGLLFTRQEFLKLMQVVDLWCSINPVHLLT